MALMEDQFQQHSLGGNIHRFELSGLEATSFIWVLNFLPGNKTTKPSTAPATHASSSPKKRAVLELPQRYFCRLFDGRATRRCLKLHDLPVLLLNGIVFRPPLPRIGENNVQRTV